MRQSFYEAGDCESLSSLGLLGHIDDVGFNMVIWSF